MLTVVWQSITRQYWPAGETARVDSAIEAAARRYPIARVSMEYPSTSGSAPLAELVVSGPAGMAARCLATVGDHGAPVQMLPGEFHIRVG